MARIKKVATNGVVIAHPCRTRQTCMHEYGYMTGVLPAQMAVLLHLSPSSQAAQAAEGAVVRVVLAAERAIVVRVLAAEGAVVLAAPQVGEAA